MYFIELESKQIFQFEIFVAFFLLLFIFNWKPFSYYVIFQLYDRLIWFIWILVEEFFFSDYYYCRFSHNIYSILTILLENDAFLFLFLIYLIDWFGWFEICFFTQFFFFLFLFLLLSIFWVISLDNKSICSTKIQSKNIVWINLLF